MANLIQQRQKELMAQEITENPEIARGKKLCGIFALIWVITRVIHLVIELILASTVDPSILSPSNIAVMAIVVLAAIAVYNGAKGFVILPIFGGALMTAQIFTSKLYLMLGSDYIPLARIYAFAFIVASVVQLVFPIVLLVASSSRLYLDTAQRIAKEVTAEFKK